MHWFCPVGDGYSELLGREEDRYIPWDWVRRFGEGGIVLVDREPFQPPPQADMD